MDALLRNSRFPRFPLRVFFVSALAACSSSDSGTGPPPPGPDVTPATVAIVGGNNQTAQVGSMLGEALVVRVTNAAGTALSGIAVVWSVESGGGTLSSASTTTDAVGQTQTNYTVGNSPGANTIRATAQGTTINTTFSAMATAPPPPADTVPAAIEIVAGNNQSATVGTGLQMPLEVRTTNAAGEPLPGMDISWTVTVGGGQLNEATTTTNAAGIASNLYSVGPAPGVNTIEVAVTSDVALSVAFTATGTAAATVTEIAVSDNFFAPQDASVGVGGDARWTWSGNNPHNVTWVSAGFTNSPTQNAGTHDVQFPAAGSFDYYCTIHGTPTSGMRGTVTVQ